MLEKKKEEFTQRDFKIRPVKRGQYRGEIETKNEKEGRKRQLKGKMWWL